jgi:hypothetical protein
MTDLNLARGAEAKETATLFLDSNVINELMTPLDLDRAIAAHMALPKNRRATLRLLAFRRCFRVSSTLRGSARSARQGFWLRTPNPFSRSRRPVHGPGVLISDSRELQCSIT